MPIEFDCAALLRGYALLGSWQVAINVDALIDDIPSGIALAGESASVTVGKGRRLHSGWDHDLAAETKGRATLDAHAEKKLVRDDPGAVWPEPDSLSEHLAAEPYPVDALPALLRDAVIEVQGFVLAPIPLVACSALSSLSVAAQGLADVRRDAQLRGPVSLYFLAVADSGERKTTCDEHFGRLLRDWETQRLQELAPQVINAEANLAAFGARKSGLEDAIKRASRSGKDCAVHEHQLRDLMKNKPARPIVPKLIYTDATTEQLAYSLATGWPSGGVLSAEAGTVFGSHSMGQETILRNLALLNVLWDGGEICVDRRTKESFLLRGRRLSFGLMVQEAALRGFLERAGTLPRGSGFLSRFLIAWPASTQGQRAYKSAPTTTPHLDRFSTRIRELLSQPLTTDHFGCLTPTTIELSDPAREAWMTFHDTVEHEVGATGELRDVRDVAAKSAENAARMAALFHLTDMGTAGSISRDHMEMAAQIVAWHLTEARRLLTEVDAPGPLAAAIRLDRWLVTEAFSIGSSRIPTQRVRQYGPYCARQDRDLREAMHELQERGRARFEQDGRRRYISINPALMSKTVSTMAPSASAAAAIPATVATLNQDA
jgi:putative DNA primase/helicase